MCPLVNGELAQQDDASNAGLILTCLGLKVAPASRPNFLIEAIARVLVKVAASIPLAEAVRGKLPFAFGR